MLRRAKFRFSPSFSLEQNRWTTTSDFVVFVVFVGILKWYTLFLRFLFYIGRGRAGRACPVGSFAKQIIFVLVSRLPSLVVCRAEGRSGMASPAHNNSRPSSPRGGRGACAVPFVPFIAQAPAAPFIVYFAQFFH